MSEPVVSDEDFAAGPLLLPGLPGIPVPEFCPLGTVTWPPPGRSVVCAEAGSVTIASAIAPISNLNMANSLLYDKKAEACRLHTAFPRNAFADHFVPGQQHPNSGDTSPADELARIENQDSVSGDGLGSMLRAPIPHFLRSDSLIRTHNAINSMTLEQLRTGIF